MTVEQIAWEQQNEDMEKRNSNREEESTNLPDDINAEYKAGAEVQNVAIHDDSKSTGKS